MMVQINLTTEQCRQLAELLKETVMTSDCNYETLESYVMMRQALLAAKTAPEGGVTAPQPVQRSERVSPAKDAAQFKYATLARLENYRAANGQGSLDRLASACECSDISINADVLRRMLGREKFPIPVWRSVAAGLDKMEDGKGLEVSHA